MLGCTLPPRMPSPLRKRGTMTLRSNRAGAVTRWLLVVVGHPVRSDSLGQPLQEGTGLAHAASGVGFDVGQRVRGTDAGGFQVGGGQQRAAGDGDDWYARRP